MNETQKLYVYADESGQDYASKFFVVVAVVSVKDQEEVRKQLTSIEQTAGTNRKKWHKLRHNHRMRYLTLPLCLSGKLPQEVCMRRIIKNQFHTFSP